MGIQCHCSKCGARFAVGKEFEGKKVRCVGCGELVALPPKVQEIVTPEPPQSEPPAGEDESLRKVLGLDSTGTNYRNARDGITRPRCVSHRRLRVRGVSGRPSSAASRRLPR